MGGDYSVCGRDCHKAILVETHHREVGSLLGLQLAIKSCACCVHSHRKLYSILNSLATRIGQMEQWDPVIGGSKSSRNLTAWQFSVLKNLVERRTTTRAVTSRIIVFLCGDWCRERLTQRGSHHP